MFNRRGNKKQPEPQQTITITTAQAILLKCASGCGQDANPDNAVPTGTFGLGKVTFYLCNDCEGTRREQKGKHDFKKKQGKEE